MAMVKRERFSEDECKVSSVDRISALPDELLASILCWLSLKEATATSILRGRWRYLHTLTRKLDLDGTESFKKLDVYLTESFPPASEFDGTDEQKSKYVEWVESLKPLLEPRTKTNEDRCKYVKWVDGVIALHKRCSRSTILEEFRVLFDLDRSNTESVDEWLRYAVSRKVQTLDLNLTYQFIGGYFDDLRCYTFPYKEGNLPNDFNFIKRLSTNCVNVSGEAVALFLRNCPLLEHLSLARSGDLSDLEIIETFPSFKCLEISLCCNLKSVVIRDSNIVCVKVHTGKRIQHFAVANVPLLTEIWFSGMLLMGDFFDMFSSVLPQIEVFKLYVSYELLSQEGINGIKNFCSGVELSNLQKFVLDTGDFNRDEESLLPLTNLLRVSPRLQRFVLEAPQRFYEDDEIFARQNSMATPRKMERAESAATKIPISYPYLKEVEFVGYRDVSNQFELVMHFVENAVAIENIVVDPLGFKLHFDSRWERVRQTKIDDRKFANAHQLKKYVPSRINLKVL